MLDDLNVRPAFCLVTQVHVDGHRSWRLMLVLRTGGCVYDTGKKGCSMCDFRFHAAPEPVNTQQLLAQLEHGLEVVGREEIVEQVDLLSLGSILHSKEVPRAFLYQALERIASNPRIKKIVIESRAEYVTAQLLTTLKKLVGEKILELGLGVETTNDRLRDGLNKGLTKSRILRTIDTCAEAAVDFQPYLLIGTPGLNGHEEFKRDACSSARHVAEWCRERGVRYRIAFEPVFVTQNTKLEREYVSGRYQLPNLWTIVSVLRETHRLGTLFVGMSDEGLSKNRTPTACERCADSIRSAIEEFNGAQDIGLFDLIHCDCPGAMSVDARRYC